AKALAGPHVPAWQINTSFPRKTARERPRPPLSASICGLAAKRRARFRCSQWKRKCYLATPLAPMADSSFPKGNRAEQATPEIAGWMAGEYRLGRKLGEGGFGAVYEAVHPLLKRRAAVKVLHRIAGSDSDAVLRFVAEARAVN